MRKNHNVRVLSLMLAAVICASALTACGDDSKETATGQTQSDADPVSEQATETPKADESDAPDAATPTVAEQYPEEDIDEKWIEVLKENGTFYDAFYNYPKIMEEEEPNHPDNIKVPDGIIRENNDYYIPELETVESESVSASEIVGRWIPIYSMYQDIKSDFTWAKDAGVDFHLILNADGTETCNMYGGEKPGKWNDKTIEINGMECTYGMEEGNLILKCEIAPGCDMYYAFERDGENAVETAKEDAPPVYLGHKLEDAKVYRLKGDTDLDPATHFVVLVETDEETHNGYGYIRNGELDTALYYQGDRGIIKLINENTADRSSNMGRTKYELEDDGKTLRMWPKFKSTPEDVSEYELCEDEEAPRCRLAVGPVPNRNEMEIPEGTHEKAGVYRLDKVYGYMYVARDPLMENPEQDQEYDETVFGEDSRKYDADVWYVLKDDGTGYMRVWDKYFEVVWSDDIQYYYDISGKHQLGTVVGEIDYDGTFMKLFKDELNPVPEYPDELKDK